MNYSNSGAIAAYLVTWLSLGTSAHKDSAQQAGSQQAQKIRKHKFMVTAGQVKLYKKSGNRFFLDIIFSSSKSIHRLKHPELY